MSVAVLEKKKKKKRLQQLRDGWDYKERLSTSEASAALLYTVVLNSSDTAGEIDWEAVPKGAQRALFIQCTVAAGGI